MTIKPDKPTDMQRTAPYHIHATVPGTVGRTSSTPRSSEKVTPIASASDEVLLSDRAREILVARQAMLASPEVRAERVEEIRRNIRDGRYEHDADKLADALIRKNVVDLLA